MFMRETNTFRHFRFYIHPEATPELHGGYGLAARLPLNRTVLV